MASDELRRMFEADQDLRRQPLNSPWAFARMLRQDSRRRRRVKRLLTAGAVRSPEDEYHAAMMLQHSLRLEDYWQAHTLACQAAEAGYGPARWLTAAALDRWLMRQGRPQKYGTQFVPADLPRWLWWLGAWRGRFRLWDVDPATTDAERAEWGIPPLEIAREQAATIGQMRVPARLGPTIANLNTTDLSVEVQDIQAIWTTAPPGAGGPPRAEPLRPQDTPEAVPLPPGTRLCRVGEGFGGVDADGTVVVLWRRVPAPSGQPYRYHWRWPHPPRLVETRVAEHAAVCIEGEPDGGSVLVTRADPAALWYVWGTLDRAGLVQLAESLPRAP
jgi:hypothetical protein